MDDMELGLGLGPGPGWGGACVYLSNTRDRECHAQLRVDVCGLNSQRHCVECNAEKME